MISESSLTSEHYFFKITLSLGKSALSDILLALKFLVIIMHCQITATNYFVFGGFVKSHIMRHCLFAVPDT